jgi:hypothetical protein
MTSLYCTHVPIRTKSTRYIWRNIVKIIYDITNVSGYNKTRHEYSIQLYRYKDFFQSFLIFWALR